MSALEKLQKRAEKKIVIPEPLKAPDPEPKEDPVKEIPKAAEPKEEKKEYDDMIASFVSDELKLGNVERVFGQYWGLAHIMNGSEGDVRAYYTALCKTEDGTMVEVSFDMGEKRVNSFDTTVVHSSEH